MADGQAFIFPTAFWWRPNTILSSGRKAKQIHFYCLYEKRHNNHISPGSGKPFRIYLCYTISGDTSLSFWNYNLANESCANVQLKSRKMSNAVNLPHNGIRNNTFCNYGLTTRPNTSVRTRSPISGEMSLPNCWSVVRKRLSLLSCLAPQAGGSCWLAREEEEEDEGPLLKPLGGDGAPLSAVGEWLVPLVTANRKMSINHDVRPRTSRSIYIAHVSKKAATGAPVKTDISVFRAAVSGSASTGLSWTFVSNQPRQLWEGSHAFLLPYIRRIKSRGGEYVRLSAPHATMRTIRGGGMQLDIDVSLMRLGCVIASFAWPPSNGTETRYLSCIW